MFWYDVHMHCEKLLSNNIMMIIYNENIWGLCSILLMIFKEIWKNRICFIKCYNETLFSSRNLKYDVNSLSWQYLKDAIEKNINKYITNYNCIIIYILLIILDNILIMWNI